MTDAEVIEIIRDWVRLREENKYMKLILGHMGIDISFCPEKFRGNRYDREI